MIIVDYIPKGGVVIKKIFCIILFACLLALGSLHAQSIFSPITYRVQSDVMRVHTGCAATKSCSLVRVRFLVQDYHFTIDNEDVFGTHLVAWYETSSVNALQDYVFVQLVRGCRYTSTWNNEREEVAFDFDQKIFGAYRPAVFQEWIIDSVDTDPVYNSVPNFPRHFFYRWNTPPYSISRFTEKIFGRARPAKAILYVSDFPSQGIHMPSLKRAASASFQYKIGLYKSEDVPTETTAENIHFAHPLVEFEWQNSWVYNHIYGTFQKMRDISPTCGNVSAT